MAREREVSDVIASAVAAGKYAPGDEPKLRAMAAGYGTDGLREMVATVPDGAAGPVRALASGAQIPVDARTMTDAEMAGEAQTRAKANGTTYREEFRKLRAEKGRARASSTRNLHRIRRGHPRPSSRPRASSPTAGKSAWCPTPAPPNTPASPAAQVPRRFPRRGPDVGALHLRRRRGVLTSAPTTG